MLATWNPAWGNTFEQHKMRGQFFKKSVEKQTWSENKAGVTSVRIRQLFRQKYS